MVWIISILNFSLLEIYYINSELLKLNNSPKKFKMSKVSDNVNMSLIAFLFDFYFNIFNTNEYLVQLNVT